MATYVIGDVQGCFRTFQRLLTAIRFNPSADHLIFAGDLIARGEDSLGMLQWVLANQDTVSAVLGNHDLHFLAVATGIKHAKAADRTQPLLESTQLSGIIDWYRKCPLAIDLPVYRALIVHAGIWPGFDRETFLESIKLVHEQLRGPEWIATLKSMYGNEPVLWASASSNNEKVRFLINAATRMRFVQKDSLALEFGCKEAPQDAPSKLIAWMDAENRIPVDRQILFGHWASLNGRIADEQTMALDTGCVWGGLLTAVRLEDRKLFQVKG
jgi:bis(5'-nucleosyl)-tetraphosphatase (symmetrical)